jgi:hypothetical protein
MEASLLTMLPNLSIGVISVFSLVYVVQKFLVHLDERTTRHEGAMLERETQIRKVEEDVRTTVLMQLSINTASMNDTAKVMERVMKQLDKK